MAEEARADAPGRVNLIGEHTDYHDGFVLPTVLPQRTISTVRSRDDLRVRAWSSIDPERTHEFELGAERCGRGWLDYVQGVTVGLSVRGFAVRGFDLRVESNVPVGAGVASSAALEVSVLRALRKLFHLSLDDVSLARVAQAAETEFVRAPIGIMDQMAASVGRAGDALLLDTRTLVSERIKLPDAMDLVVIDSGITHRHAGGEYAARRRESFEAAALLGVAKLRDLDVDALPRLADLPPVQQRRARHIITENRRVLDAVAALRAGDSRWLGELFDASHASMRDDYEVSTPDIDTLTALGTAHADVYGARLTGGGFGGAVVMVTGRGAGRRCAFEIAAAYRERTGRTASVVLPSLA